MAFFGWRVGVVEGHDTEGLLKDAEVEETESNIEREVTGNGCKVSCTENIHAVVVDVEAPSSTFQGRPIVA